MTSHTGPPDVPFALCPFVSATFFLPICVTSSLPYRYCSHARAWRGQLTHTHTLAATLCSQACARLQARFPPAYRL